ncbi:MAG: hypothetical protein O3B43_07015, partial [Chloroflexi bacterium]|nr:hypothetical protein [Chloroflexota bacterium]
FIVNDLEDPACLVQISAEDGSVDEKIVSVENPLAPGESAQIHLPVGLQVHVRVEGCSEDFLHVFDMEIPPEGFSYHLGAD